LEVLGLRKRIKQGLPALMLMAICLAVVNGPALAETVAAKVGDQQITLSELDAELKSVNSTAVQAWYDARRAALEGMIAQMLFTAEAKARGISEDELTTIATAKTTPISEDQITNFYNQNKARMGERTLDQLRPQIQSYLENSGQQQAMNNFLDKLREKQGVRIHLDPPRVDVKIAANDPYKGSIEASVKIVEYSDFQ
jgi:hypothetical protein